MKSWCRKIPPFLQTYTSRKKDWFSNKLVKHKPTIFHEVMIFANSSKISSIYPISIEVAYTVKYVKFAKHVNATLAEIILFIGQHLLNVLGFTGKTVKEVQVLFPRTAL